MAISALEDGQGGGASKKIGGPDGPQRTDTDNLMG